MKLAVVAGEASGDLHGSEVIAELRKLDAKIEAFGIGGDLLAAQGVQILHHARELGIVGLFNVLRHLPMFRRVFRDLVDRVAAEKPDVVLLIDYPDFNLRVARRCKKLGLRVVYYISPQLWAWRRGRVRQIAESVDRMIVIFPFEEEFYRQHGVPVTYVGHPLIEQLGHIERPARNGGPLKIALLPGSRRGELRALLPPMLDAVKLLRAEREIESYVVQAPTIARHEIEAMLERADIDIPIVDGRGGEAVASADLALSSSGTATLECAVLGTPVVVMYKLSRATYLLARRLVRLPHFSLVNIVAGKEVVPELIQDDVNGPRIAAEVLRMAAPETYGRLSAELKAIRSRLGETGTAARAAQEIVRLAGRP